MIAKVPWTLQDLGLYIILLVIEVITIMGIVFFLSLLSAFLGFSPDAVTSLLQIEALPQGVIIFLSFLLQSFLLLFPIIIISWLGKYRNFFNNLLLRKVSWYQVTIYPVVALFSTIGILVLFNYFTLMQGVEVPGFHGDKTQVISYFGGETLSLIFAFTTGVFVAPVVEEMVFRGFILGTCLKYMPSFIGILVSSAIFAAFHMTFGVFFPLFFIGMVLAVLTWHTKSIWPAIIFHMLNNSLAFVEEFYRLFS